MPFKTFDTQEMFTLFSNSVGDRLFSFKKKDNKLCPVAFSAATSEFHELEPQELAAGWHVVQLAQDNGTEVFIDGKVNHLQVPS